MFNNLAHISLEADTIWLTIGFLGQALFFMRFFVQWIASEKAKKSVVPDLFWYFSLGGGAVLLFYAIHRQDPVFILGQSMGLLIYLRNIHFLKNTGHDASNDQAS